MWHCWICGSVEWDMNVKLDNTTEFVTLLNVWDCWMRWDCDIRLYNWICWHYWISATFERDEKMLHGWIFWTVEWDMNVKLDYTTKFVTLLNMWDCEWN